MHPEVTDMIRLANKAKPTIFLFMICYFSYPTCLCFAVVIDWMVFVSKGLIRQLKQLNSNAILMQ